MLPVAAAEPLEGDLIDQADADTEAELQVRLHQSNARLRRAIEEVLARIPQAKGQAGGDSGHDEP